MSEKFVIEGGRRLEGEVEIKGSKNAAGALIAATLLTKNECILKNIPLVSDILNLLEIIKGIGAEIKWLGERELKIVAKEIDPFKIDFEKVSKSRVSVLLIGSLLPRFKEFKISRPGGDRIGLRPITTHLKALKELGAVYYKEGDFYYFKTKKLQGKEIVLSEFSVTATENLMMSACFGKGKTIIKGAAAEPEVQNLAEFLKAIGARIKGESTHIIEIEGVDELGGTTFEVIPDRIEAGTFLSAAALAGQHVIIKKIRIDHLDLFLAKLKEMGVNFRIQENSVELFLSKDFKPVKIQAFPYPGFATDLLPVVVPILTQCPGKSLIHDPLYENRFNYILELRKMGADIEIVDPHRAFVFGKTNLHGVTIESWDIRAGASLIIAALIAEGKTILQNIEQIDRGYEKIEERLQKLGAYIQRINN